MTFHHSLFLILLLSLDALLGNAFTLRAQPMDKAGDAVPAVRNKTIIFLGSDFKNRSIGTVYRGFQTAARLLNWKVSIEDGSGQWPRLRQQLEAAIAAKPDGIVIAGFQIDSMRELVQSARRAKIALVGWHASPFPGPQDELFTNVTALNQDIASMAVDYILAHRQGPCGVVILSDDSFSIARYKATVMRDLLLQSGSCRVLALEQVAISEAARTMPGLVERLNALFGNAWTHTLAVNDVYFDHINFPLLRVNRRNVINVAAGDGAANALSRIKGGRSQQAASVAEPLRAQGWQLADELNRAFTGREPSGFMTKPLLVTHELLQKQGRADIENDEQLAAAYRQIWFKSEARSFSSESKVLGSAR